MLERAIQLLDRLISTPSISRAEDGTASVIQLWLGEQGIESKRIDNNVYAINLHYDPALPTVLLNSHHDTVKPSPSYTIDPFTPLHRDDRIYGLGSNDAGASLVSLASLFCHLYDKRFPYNLILGLSAEEEVSGERGMRALYPHLKSEGYRIDMGIVGEPTKLQPAVAERGLMVLDCTAHGVTGHAARNEGVNALYIALDDIQRLRSFGFDRVSPTLGPIKITVTQIQAGRQHNVIPEECTFVADVRTTDAYTNEETEAIIAAALKSEVKARSYRVRASVIDRQHPLVQAAVALGKEPFVSPTTSDMAMLPDIPTLKIGPGDSARSHSADEYICISEIAEGIDTYMKILENLKIS